MLHTKSIKELHQGLITKEFSSHELTQHFLDRISQYDGKINSYITVTSEQALNAADVADSKISKNENISYLTGIPVAHKDIFCTKNIKTTCGSKMLSDFKPPYDATVISKLIEKDAISLGKTNLDEFAMGGTCENSYYGPSMNPWNLEYVPGGSSGGSAAAVAARLAPIATGTDTGGSIRQPAAFCGVTGLKPTYGRISRYGMIAFASSLDQGGPIGRSAEDIAIFLEAVSGKDPRDMTSANIDVPNYLASIENPIKGVRIGLPEEFFSESLSPEIVKKTEEVIAVLKEQGAIFKKISLKNSKYAVPTYYIVAPSEASSNLARYDGIKYGYRTKNSDNLESLYNRSRSEAFGVEVKRRILIGTYALSSGYYDAFYQKAQKIRQIIKEDFVTAFEEVDLILGPTTPSAAYKLGSKINDPVSMYLGDIYTIPANLAGLPGISMPAGFIDNMPIGVQLIGPAFSESLMLNVGHIYQKNTDWHTMVPKDYTT
jgi:aspartyl-tRNA(Asn)/glutamyl-tRNA(Gln) amidotransferase subunit A